MTDFDRIGASAPANKQAAMSSNGGVHFTPEKKFADVLDECPSLRTGIEAGNANPQFVNFTGRTFGRLTVLGMTLPKERRKAMATWVCRCACGNFTQRTSKSLKVADRGGNSFQDRCGPCGYTEYLRNRPPLWQELHEASQ